MAEKFWVLESPKIRTARWDVGNAWRKHDYCDSSAAGDKDAYIGFGGPANRVTDLRVVLKTADTPDFAWTIPDCLVHDNVVNMLREEGFTGFDLRQARVRMDSPGQAGKKSSGKAQALPSYDEDAARYWEMVVTGWGGVAPEECGIERIPGTNIWEGYPDWSGIVDWDAWDGSDFFIVWPFGFTRLVTDRVAQFIVERNLRGARLITPDEYTRMHKWMQLSRTIPLRLRDHFPDDRAKAIGEPLGIY